MIPETDVPPAAATAGLGATPPDDRRRGTDRRARPTRPFDVLRGYRRRRAARRTEERQGIYTDRLGTPDVLLVLSIFVLNLLDAYLTLDILLHGAEEANPVMAALLGQSQGVFLAEKIAVVGFCLVILGAHRHFRLARLGLVALLVLYAGLFLYHLNLQAAAAAAAAG